MNAPLITLTTDFGTSDPYVGVMKGVILGINPQASVIDISHHVEPQSILAGAFIIGTSHRFFPKGTIHVVVVDPEVGTSRNALLLITPSASFLAPDNGVLSYILGEGFRQETEVPKVPALSEVKSFRMALPQDYKAYHLSKPEFWLHPISSTFHGRDIFAPVAAHLSLGVPDHRLGQEIRHIAWLPRQEPSWDGDTLVGHVVHIDHFGNLITDIPAHLLTSPGPFTVSVKGRCVTGLSSSYAEGGWLLAIVGSHGNLEVSVKNGSAVQELHARVGDAVRVTVARRTTSP